MGASFGLFYQLSTFKAANSAFIKISFDIRRLCPCYGCGLKERPKYSKHVYFLTILNFIWPFTSAGYLQFHGSMHWNETALHLLLFVVYKLYCDKSAKCHTKWGSAVSWP